MRTRDFIQQLEHDSIVKAIREAEKKTSGEIRVFISSKSPRDPIATARRRFVKLGMDRTEEHNAVMIYVAPRSRKFAIVGDRGVHTRCGDQFWRELMSEMSGHFRQDNYTQGLIHVIHRAGELLAKHFPPKPGDKNELPDDIAHD